MPHSDPTSISRDDVCNYLERLRPVVDFDLEAHFGDAPEFAVSIPAEHDLNCDAGFQIAFAPDDADLCRAPVWQLPHFVNAYEIGTLTERTRLRTPSRTWVHLAPGDNRALALQQVTTWRDDILTLGALDVGGQSFGAWIERGLTPFAFGLLKARGLHDDAVPAFWSSDLYLTVGHPAGAPDAAIDYVADAFLFELAARYRLLLEPQSYPEYVTDFDDAIEADRTTLVDAYHAGALHVPSIPTGVGATELVSLWLRGKRASDAHSAIIAYARVVEFVSATTSRQSAHTQLRLLLGTRDLTSLDATFLDSLLEQASLFVSVRREDRLLIQSAVSTCCVPGTMAQLLAPLKAALAKKLASGTAADATAALTDCANILYATRNALVHAKANYAPTGDEIGEESLVAFVPIAEHMALSCVRWFMQQPEATRVVQQRTHRKVGGQR